MMDPSAASANAAVFRREGEQAPQQDALLGHNDHSPIPAAPPSSSALSDAPESTDKDIHPDAADETASADFSLYDSVLQARPNGAALNTIASSIAAPVHSRVPTLRGNGLQKRGRPSKRAGYSARSAGTTDDLTIIKVEGVSTPGSAERGASRARGSGRAKVNGRKQSSGRPSKRKRHEDDDDDDDDDDEETDASDSSDEVTPMATMTKSGRAIQKPTSFIPPPPSPMTNRRKRPYSRKNAESAVCKICLRGTSPTSNMIVFCDGCNTPYHRYCHKPPIDQKVVEEVEAEWFCCLCESERVGPVPEADIATLVSAEGSSEEQRTRYFAGLRQGMLVALLTKATSLHPTLPLFAPEFKNQTQSSELTSTNGHPRPRAVSVNRNQSSRAMKPSAINQEAEGYGPEVHPENYPRPGQGLLAALPPETDDLDRLVEDDDKYGVFTHVYQHREPLVSSARTPAEPPME